MTKQSPLIECRELTKVYPGGKASPVRAVDRVDLKVYKGEFVVIVGRSGVGKSTLLNLMGGLDRPTSGTVVFDGNAIEKMSDKELARIRMNKIGFVFQDYNLLPAYSALENIELTLAPSEPSRKKRRERGEKLLRDFGLIDRADHLSVQLSLGEQQRVAIARALVNNPILILADEPSGGIDPTTAKEIVARFVELNQKDDVTLVIATHGAFPRSLASRVLYMKGGRIVSQEDASQQDCLTK